MSLKIPLEAVIERVIRVRIPASSYVGIHLISWYRVAHGAQVRSSRKVSSEILGKSLNVIAMTI